MNPTFFLRPVTVLFLLLSCTNLSLLPGISLSDCNNNGIGDPIELLTSPTLDCNNNNRLDVCEIYEAQGYVLVGPPGETCTDAPFVCNGVVVADTTTGHFSDPGLIETCRSRAPDVWFKYQPAASGDVTVSLCGSNYDTMLHVYADCPGIVEVACNDDSARCDLQSIVTFSAAAGQIYYIRVSGFERSEGDFQMLITGPDCVPPVLTEASGGPLDCNSDGVLDECQTLPDCNNNGTPDACELHSTFSAESDQLSPLKADEITTFSLNNPPPAFGGVKLTIKASGDLDYYNEYVDVTLNNILIGQVFNNNYGNCPILRQSIWQSAQDWNSTAAGGSALFSMIPSPQVDSTQCPPPPTSNFIQIQIEYTIQSDYNCNGVLDECEITSGTVFDCNGNMIPDEYDLFFDAASQSVAQDDCADAEPIIHNVDYEGTFVGATPDGFSSCDMIGKAAASGTERQQGVFTLPDVWYRYTPCTTGTATVRLCQLPLQEETMILSVHKGCPGTELNEVACTELFDECVTLTFYVEACTTYSIRVAQLGFAPLAALQGPITGPPTFILTLLDGPPAKIPEEFRGRAVDSIPPIIICPDDIEFEAEQGLCGANVIVPIPDVVENCGIKSLSNDYTHTSDASGFYPEGVTTVLWTAVDVADNVSTCSMTVTVSDNEPPILECPEPIETTSSDEMCGAVVEVPLPDFSDNCALKEVLNDYTQTTDASGTYPVGTTTVTWTAVDVADNVTTCATTITVHDVTPPLIECGPDLVVEGSTTDCTALVTVPPPAASDNCELAALTNSFNGTADASGVYPPGVTTIIWTATDIHDNVTTCSQTVTVVCSIACDLTPTEAVNPTLTTHTVTLSLKVNDQPTSNIAVTFEVIAGPNTGAGGNGITDAGGRAEFTWMGLGGEGTDIVVAGGSVGSVDFLCTATKTWVAPPTPTPTPTPTPSPSPTPTPTPTPTPCFVGSWTFDTGSDGWTTGGASVVFPLPGFSSNDTALQITPREFFSFGFWQSPMPAIPTANPALIYVAEFGLRWDGEACLHPLIRLRALGSRFEQKDIMGVDSRGDCSYGPGAVTKPYRMFIMPQGGGAEDNFLLAFDVLNFDPFNSLSGAVSLDYVTVDCMTFEELGEQTMQRLFTFDASTEGWTSGTAALLHAPNFFYTGSSLGMTSTDNVLNFGFWNSPAGAILSTPGNLLFARFRVLSGPQPTGSNASIRIRLITDDSQGYRYMEIPAAPLIEPTEGAPEPLDFYLIYEPPALDAPNNGLAASFDLINFSLVGPEEVTVELQEVEISDIVPVGMRLKK
ncbi:MAG: hypothetical protein Kow0059_07790 [Candidatus Sumerlaeia bacterium]